MLIKLQICGEKVTLPVIPAGNVLDALLLVVYSKVHLGLRVLTSEHTASV